MGSRIRKLTIPPSRKKTKQTNKQKSIVILELNAAEIAMCVTSDDVGMDYHIITSHVTRDRIKMAALP